MKKRFRWRSFISFGLFFFFLVILLSGLVLYIAPAGRIANWTDWKLIGLTKLQWQTLHTNFTFLFAILTIFHLFTINWKTFWSYIKSKARSGLNHKRELWLSSLLTILIFIGVLFLIPPFGAVMEIGENIRERWEKEHETPPVPHAEEYTIASLSSDILQISEEDIVSGLNELGIEVGSNEQTLKELAGQVEMSPQEIYNRLVPDIQRPSGTIIPESGIGRKTLQQISVESGIPVEELLALLKNAGIEASAEDTMKDLADRYEQTPSGILSILNGSTPEH